eukprot:TRINITY_DN66213_c3_g1_i3.p1 TRINITY_DN66213_c3_g1~~TRINITY_DN66213_c3_g1_i3.p1  ORF type:complete len:109 (+),score=10.76 TRINITY_DN66213_c3_g1_i3:32-358(+)
MRFDPETPKNKVKTMCTLGERFQACFGPFLQEEAAKDIKDIDLLSLLFELLKQKHYEQAQQQLVEAKENPEGITSHIGRKRRKMNNREPGFQPPVENPEGIVYHRGLR